MSVNEVLQEIILQLGDNYQPEDLNILTNDLMHIIRQASFISNRDIDVSQLDKQDKNLTTLCSEIIDATIIKYQRRGTEYAKNKSELGESSTFIDPDELLRINIIKNGKRVIF